MIHHISGLRTEITRHNQLEKELGKPGFFLSTENFNKDSWIDKILMQVKTLYSDIGLIKLNQLEKFFESHIELQKDKAKALFVAGISLQVNSDEGIAPIYAQLFGDTSDATETLNFFSNFDIPVYIIKDPETQKKRIIINQKKTGFITYVHESQMGTWIIGFDYLNKKTFNMTGPKLELDQQSELISILRALGFEGPSFFHYYENSDGLVWLKDAGAFKKIDILI